VGNFALGLKLAEEAGIPPERIINSSESNYILKRGRVGR
jgi:histidinol phosphatase-like PHP family hydrolase